MSFNALKRKQNFLDEIEILEPQSLREWFKIKYSNAYKKYNSQELAF